MAWIERLQDRNLTTKTFMDDVYPLRRRLVAYAHECHYRVGIDWQDTDENFAVDTTDGYDHSATKLRHIIRIGSTGTRRWCPRRDYPNEYVSFGRLQSWSGTAWQNVNLGTPVRSGKTITWDTTNFKLTLTNTWRKIKIEAVLKTEAARRRLRWAVTLNGLTWDTWMLRGVDGSIVGTVDKPIAWDATQDPASETFTPNVTITNTYSGGYVEFGGDLSAAVLPITIDPTFTDGYGGNVTTSMDGWLQQAYPNDDVGAYTFMEIGRLGSAGGYNLQRSLFQFDVSSLSGYTINSATLTLQCTTSSDAVGYNATLHRSYVQLYEGSGVGGTPVGNCSVWNYRNYAGSVAWGAAGGLADTDYEATPTDTTPIDPAGSYTWDGAADVSAWAGGAANYGWWLLGDESLPTTRTRKIFATSDHATTAYRPKLVVDYTPRSLPISSQTRRLLHQLVR